MMLQLQLPWTGRGSQNAIVRDWKATATPHSSTALELPCFLSLERNEYEIMHSNLIADIDHNAA
eukprot:366519-Chlamydomonas_euryale.AAC.10